MKADALRDQLVALATRDTAPIVGIHGKLWPQVRQHFTVSTGVRSAGTTGSMSERELARRLSRGEAAAFDTLVELWAGKLLGYAKRSLAPADAEDVVQDAFIVLVQKAKELAEHPNLGGFLFQTVRYLIVDRLRQQARQRLSHTDVEVQLPDEQADDVGVSVIREVDFERVVQALHDVCNPLEQEVMALTLEGLDPREIGHRLDITANNARVIKHRAIQKLRDALEVDHENH